jgi:hypothetical protein
VGGFTRQERLGIALKPGKCKLCLEEEPLCESHLVPGAIYKYCWEGDLPPLRFTADEIGHSDEELTAHLLCRKCENLLNRDGENWLAPKLATVKGSFPLYDLLVKEKPDIVHSLYLGYACARNKDIAFRKITNFAAGVFWKASVHPWHKDRTGPRIELGGYREEFRLFLVHKGKFPQHATLSVTIAPPSKALISFNSPDERSKTPFHQYVFNIPGISFDLAVGKRIPDELRRMCFATSPMHYALVADLSPQIRRAVRLGTQKARNVEKATPTLPPRKER